MFKKLGFLMEEATDGTGGGGGEPAAQGGDQSPDQGAQPTNTLPSATSPSGQDAGAKGYWPDDWQNKITGGDETLAKQAGRYTSPDAMFKALIAAQTKIRSGEYKQALPKDPKPEELAEWRKENGIPESPEKYDLGKNFQIPEEDKGRIDSFLQAAHGVNLTPEQARAAIDWSYKNQEQLTAQRLELDVQQRDETTDALHVEWGASYRRNLGVINGFLDTAPESIRDLLKGARLADGRGLFNHPDAMKWFAQVALEQNPGGTVVPSGGGDPAKTVQDEINSIEKVMTTNRKQYNQDENMQARYRQLLEAREKIAARK